MDTDELIAHGSVKEDEVLLVTNKRLIFTKVFKYFENTSFH